MHLGHGHPGPRQHAINELKNRFVCPLMVNSVWNRSVYSGVDIDYRLSTLSVSRINECVCVVVGPPFPITVARVVSEMGVSVENLLPNLSEQDFSPEHGLTPSWIGVSHDGFLPTLAEIVWMDIMLRHVYKTGLTVDLKKLRVARF